MSVLARRPDETVEDHVERLLVDPLMEGATSMELAEHVRCNAAKVRKIRSDLSTGPIRARLGESFVALCRKTAHFIGWTKDDGGLLEMLKAALVALEEQACHLGKCRHITCMRQRGEMPASSPSKPREQRSAATPATASRRPRRGPDPSQQSNDYAHPTRRTTGGGASGIGSGVAATAAGRSEGARVVPV